MTNNYSKFSYFIFAALSMATSLPSYADKGVFNPQITPDELFTTEIPATVTVSAEIGDIPMNDISVYLYQSSKKGKILTLISELFLDKSQGLFSSQFTIENTLKTKRYYRIIAKYNSEEEFKSTILEIDIFSHLPDGISIELLAVLKSLEESFKEYLKYNNLATARKMVLKEAENNPNIISASISGEDLSIIYRQNIRGIVFLHNHK